MLLRLLLVVVMCAAVASAALARQRRADPTPSAHTPCSVLDGEPCTPSVCSVFNSGPCFPEINYPTGQNLQLTVLTPPDDQPGDNSATKLLPAEQDKIGDLFAALRACWRPPPIDEARADMQITVKISFRRSGALFASPTVTFATPGVASNVRDRYRTAVTDSLAACTPFKFTDALGGAVAGRPILVRYVDRRVAPRQADAPAR